MNCALKMMKFEFKMMGLVYSNDDKMISEGCRAAAGYGLQGE